MSAALQAADYLAWHTNRDLSSPHGDLEARFTALATTECFIQRYDYDELLRTASQWRSGGGYNAVRESS